MFNILGVIHSHGSVPCVNTLVFHGVVVWRVANIEADSVETCRDGQSSVVYLGLGVNDFTPTIVIISI